MTAAVHGKNGAVPDVCMRYHQHHQHHQQIRPAASSTPTKQGAGRDKAAERTKVRNMKEKRTCSTPPPPSIPRVMAGREGPLQHAGSADDLPHPQAHGRKEKVHRRLQTEPGAVSSLANLFPPARSWGDMRATAERSKLAKQRSSTSPPELPPPPPPLFNPYCHPYAFPYYPAYPFPCYPQLPPPDWPQDMGEHAPLPPPRSKTETEALDLATLHHQYSRPFHLDYYHSYYRDMIKFQKVFSKTQDQAKPGATVPESIPHGGPAQSKRTTGNQAADIASRPKDNPGLESEDAKHNVVHQNVLDVQGMDNLLCEVLKSCEDRVHKLRTECSKLVTRL